MLNEQTVTFRNNLFAAVMSNTAKFSSIVEFFTAAEPMADRTPTRRQAFARMATMANALDKRRENREVLARTPGRDLSRYDVATEEAVLSFARYGAKVFNQWDFWPYGKPEAETAKDPNRVVIDMEGNEHQPIDVIMFLIDIAIAGEDRGGKFVDQIHNDTAAKYYHIFAQSTGSLNPIQMEKGRRLAGFAMRRAKVHTALGKFATLYPESDVALKLDKWNKAVTNYGTPIKGETEAVALERFVTKMNDLKVKLAEQVAKCEDMRKITASQPDTLPELPTLEEILA